MLVAVLAFSAPALGAELKPYQQAALDQILSTVEPQFRDAMRGQLEETLSMLSEEQVALMLSAMDEQAAEEEPAPEDYAQEAEETASPEDRAHNRTQYEPVMRDLWALQSQFDGFVETELAAHCPGRDAYAVFGSAWRYEVYPLQPNWTRASGHIDTNVEIIGQSYAPQDGRYVFDFSAVRTTYDDARVAEAIRNACDRHREVGETFLAEARPLADREDFEALAKIERRANGEMGLVLQELETVLEEESPSANAALFSALLNGRKIN